MADVTADRPEYAELAALDEAGLAAEAEALGITLEDVQEMAQTYIK